MLAGPDLLVILVIALIVFGPKKLPEIGQTIGKAMREFKKASEDLRDGFDREVKEIRFEFRFEKDRFHSDLFDAHKGLSLDCRRYRQTPRAFIIAL